MMSDPDLSLCFSSVIRKYFTEFWVVAVGQINWTIGCVTLTINSFYVSLICLSCIKVFLPTGAPR
jgi:hypothetical protein